MFARRLLYWISMAAGLVLAIVPLPSWLDPVRPDLALLAMIYFVLTSPRIAGLGYAWLSGLFLDRVRALPVVLAFQAESRITRDLARSADELATRTIRVLRVAFFSSGALEFFAALSVALVAVYCGFNLLRLLPFPVPDQLDLKRAFFVLALAPEIYLPMRRLAAAYHDRQAAEAATASLIALHDPQPRPAAPILTAPPAIRFSGAESPPEARRVRSAPARSVEGRVPRDTGTRTGSGPEGSSPKREPVGAAGKPGWSSRVG